MSRIVKTQREVGLEFDVTPEAVCKWVKRGMPKCEEGYDLDEILVWKARNVRSPVGKDSAENKEKKLVEDITALRTNTPMGIAKIAKTLRAPAEKVRNIVAMVDKHRPNLMQYKANRADVFAMEQMEYLGHITEKKLEKTPARDLAAMAKMAYDKERIERGESTENVAVIVKHILELKELEQDANEG